MEKSMGQMMLSSAEVARFTGPFFLGFVFQSLGMGAVLILCIDYLASVHDRPGGWSAHKLGTTLVVISLVTNLAQTVVDWVRGWQMFAEGFANVALLLKPSVLFFVSPFLGLFPATITQLFLLRRALLFVSSLEMLWPWLARPTVTRSLAVFMSLMIMLAVASGTGGGWLLWRTGALWELRSDKRSSPFRQTELIYLSVSSAVDVILSAALCSEMWWARKKLAPERGMMREVVTRVMLVTFHGGAAVTASQLIALFLFQYQHTSSFCYLPILPLPKIYTITLILSLSSPSSPMDPARPITLPTILHVDCSHPSEHSRTHVLHDHGGLLVHRRASSPAVLDQVQEKRYSSTSPFVKSDPGLGRTFPEHWRKSQEWLGWSLLGGKGSPSTHRPRGKSAKEEDEEDFQGRVRHSVTAPFLSMPSMSPYDYSRRPSDPSSASSLLRRPSVPMTPGTPAYLTDNGSKSTGPFDGIPSPPPISLTVSRQHSFSSIGGPTDRRPSLPFAHLSAPLEGIATSDQAGLTIHRPATELFTTLDPFGTSSSSATIAPAAGIRTVRARPMLSPLQDAAHRRSSAPDVRPTTRDQQELREHRHAERMFSFEDMLAIGSASDKDG